MFISCAARVPLPPSLHAGRHSVVRQWVKSASTSASSSSSRGSLSSPIKLSTIPAPHRGEITVVSLNRPNARNAISTQLLTELKGIVDQVHAEGAAGSTRALVLASESDDAFCAGADLKERLTFTDDDTRHFLGNLRSTFARISTLPIPTISAISSTAFGGGLELSLCTNFRVMASTASVGLPETRLAIIPGAGGTYRLPALIGVTRARDLILTGRRVSGEEAYFIGLADRLVRITEDELKGKGVARGKVLEQALDMARTICEGGPIAIAAAIQAINGWEKGEASENAAYDLVLPTIDRFEALNAFGAKRKPIFKGR